MRLKQVEARLGKKKYAQIPEHKGPTDAYKAKLKTLFPELSEEEICLITFGDDGY